MLAVPISGPPDLRVDRAPIVSRDGREHTEAPDAVLTGMHPLGQSRDGHRVRRRHITME